MKLLRIVIWTHATYILVTGLWPLIDIGSFIAATGPKQDIWLVKTVGALLLPIAICLYSYLLVNTDFKPAILLGSLTAIAFICINFYYALNDVISNVYLLDGAVEFLFLIGWVCVAVSKPWKAYAKTDS